MELCRIIHKHLAFGKRIVAAGVLITFVCGASAIASTQTSIAALRPLYVPNQVLVTLRGGVSETTVQSIANDLGGTITRRPKYSHTYVVELSGTGTPADTAIANRAGILQKYAGVESVDYNLIGKFSATPNDELYPSIADPMYPDFLTGQWQLQPASHIYAPEAWDLQKGADNVVVAVLDSGVRDRDKFTDEGTTSKLIRRIHPDLLGRVLSGYDFGDIDTDDDANPGPAPSEVPTVSIMDATHGTHVAGIIAAQADNTIGVAGLCWNNVWILPFKVAKDKDLIPTADYVIEAISYAIQWRGDTNGLTNDPMRVNVINISIGFSYDIEPLHQAIREAVRSGIVVVASAGNEWMDGAYAPGYPSAYDEVICAGATGYDDLATLFSNRGRSVDIVAPGWEILSTVWYKYRAIVDTEKPEIPIADNNTAGGASDKYGNWYDYMSGTSMSSPCIAGAAALLFSHGVPANDVRSILCSTATPKGIGRPNDSYGWGLLNIGEAIRKASIDVNISSPSKGATVSTMKPRIRIDFRHAKLDTIRVWVDPIDSNNDGAPDNAATLGGPNAEVADWQKYYYTLDEKAGKTYLLFEYAVQANRAVNGMHRVYVTAASDKIFDMPPTTPLIDTDNVLFRVELQKMGAGWRLFSIPTKFDTALKPEDVLGTTGVLARWHYTNSPYGEYALYSLDGTRTDDEATFTPISVFANSLVHPISQTDATPPAGLGYWLYLPSAADVNLPEGIGQAITDAPYVISLNYGWNMVGNPFPFPVDWSNVVVEYAGMRATAEEAVQNGWLSNSIYRYDSVYTRYTFRTVQSAVMIPWEAQWVKVKVRSPELVPTQIAVWADEFNDGVFDTTAPEPSWVESTYGGSVVESGGMLKLLGTSGQQSYVYVGDEDFPIYDDFAVDTKVYLANTGATMSGGSSSAEIQFRTSDTGIGYSLSFNAGAVPTVCLRRSDTGAVIQNSQVDYDLPSGVVLYTSIVCVGPHMKIRVGTLPGAVDVADWELNDSTFPSPGSFRLVNDGMLDCRFDYFRVRPMSIRPADVKLIVPPNAYTGAL